MIEKFLYINNLIAFMTIIIIIIIIYYNIFYESSYQNILIQNL
jgi:hypothetical protein